MVASARMSSNWAWRMGLVSVAFAVFAVWCVFDATVGYPRFNRRAAEYNRLLAAGQVEQWPAVAAGNGWSVSFREEDHLPDGRVSMKTRWDTGTQYVMMTACLVVVGAILYRLGRSWRRSFKADDNGFLTIEGVLVPYAAITDIDLRRWQRKSIARVVFRQRDRLLSTDIDDWIYKGGEAVLAELQRRTGLGAATARQVDESAPPRDGIPPHGQPGAAGENHGKPDGRVP